MSDIGIDCLVQHFVVFFAQSEFDEKANFAEPCERCKHLPKCHADYQTNMRPYFEQTGIYPTYNIHKMAKEYGREVPAYWDEPIEEPESR